jgi:MFS family permease
MYVDKLGRKPVLIVGAIGMALSHFIIAGISGGFGENLDNHHSAGRAAVVMVWLFVIHFGYSWGPCAWIVIAEIWPLSSRPYGIALGASSNWMNNFIVGQVTPDMLKHLKFGTYIFFGTCITLGALFVAFMVPETKALTLEEMDILFSGSSGTVEWERRMMEEANRDAGLHAITGEKKT